MACRVESVPKLIGSHPLISRGFRGSGGLISRNMPRIFELPVRAFIAKAPRREGFEILEAVDGLHALGLLQQLSGDVDVLVTDIKMPRMNGVEPANPELAALVRHVRQRRCGGAQGVAA